MTRKSDGNEIVEDARELFGGDFRLGQLFGLGRLSLGFALGGLGWFGHQRAPTKGAKWVQDPASPHCTTPRQRAPRKLLYYINYFNFWAGKVGRFEQAKTACTMPKSDF
jgi:hypothetical protein